MPTHTKVKSPKRAVKSNEADGARGLRHIIARLHARIEAQETVLVELFKSNSTGIAAALQNAAALHSDTMEQLETQRLADDFERPSRQRQRVRDESENLLARLRARARL